MDGNLPFLDEKEEDPTPEAAAPEPEVEPKGEPEAAPPAAVVEEKHQNIPISALLDEREKRQQAAREAEELRRKLAEYEAAKEQPKPDFYADPEAALQSVQKAAQSIALNTKLETSRFLAERDHGAETVAAAYAFFDANPHLSSQLISSPSPFHEAVKVYQRHKTMEEIGDDPSAYRARIEQEVRERLLAEMQTATPAPKAPPPSMAAVPATGNSKAPPASGFDALFKSD